jgi:signal transduction histidine kinase
MAVSVLPSFLGRRLPVRQTRGGRLADERILATARAVLAVSSLVAVYFGRTEPTRYADVAYGLLLAYTGYSLVLFTVVRFRTAITPRFSLAVHAADILWPAVVTLFTDGPNGPFFLYFIFALLAAGFRWGMGETLLTAAAATGAVLVEAFVLTRTSLAHILDARFDLNGLITRAVYLVIFGALIGYLADSENRRRGEALSISRVVSKARVQAGLKGTLEAVLRELLKIFEGSTVLLVASEAETNRAYLWRTEVLEKPSEAIFTSHQMDPSERPEYLFSLPGDCAGAVWRRGSRKSKIMMDRSGGRVRGQECYLPTEFLAHQTFARVLMCTVSASPTLSARLLVFNPQIEGNSETQLHFLQNLLNQVTPAVYNVYLLRRLRSRAAAVERARVAGELHDGVVQSLHAIGFRLYALRSQTMMDTRERDQELLQIQKLVQNEAVNIRALIQQLKPLDFDPRHLIDFLAGIIERYNYDTGIRAKFVCDLRDIAFPPYMCREVAGIVQEALVNVSKHSGAKNVVVRLASYAAGWILTIDDDGRGFEFCGRFSHAELEETRRGPMVIKERVRAIGGELSIDTRPGRGARLEIRIPQQEQATIA